MSGRPKSISSSETPPRRSESWIGNPRCDSRNSSASWLTRILNCFRARLRNSGWASSRNVEALAFTLLPHRVSAGGGRRDRHDGFERFVYDRDFGPPTDDIVKLNDVARTHAHASVAGRPANISFLGRAVNVNEAAVGIRILRFPSPQPKNSRHNRITARRIRRKNFTRRPAVLESRSAGCGAANLFRNFQFAKRRAAAARQISEGKLRRRNGIGCEKSAIIEQGQPLLGHADDDVVASVWRHAGSQANRDGDQSTDRANRHQGKRKNFSAVSVVASATSCSGMPRAAAIVSATMRVCAGSQRFPRNGTGAR